MIVVKLMGGLGNQMFQYALARSLAHKRLETSFRNPPAGGYPESRNHIVDSGSRAGMTGGRQDKFFLDTSWFANQTKRVYELNCLKIIENIAPPELTEPSLTKNSGIFSLKKIFGTKPRISIYREHGFRFDPKVLKLPDDVYLDGYWQTEKYFLNIRGVLLKEFLPKEFGARALDYKKAIESAENAVSVHVRRGDYVSEPNTNKYHGTCGSEYYREAAKIIGDKVPNPHFFVFSDDVPWVKENIALGDKVTYVEGCKNYEDLHLMSLCRHNIIANSSFSWWGAWLNEHPDKIVVTPKKWFNEPGVDTSDLVPQGWVRV